MKRKIFLIITFILVFIINNNCFQQEQSKKNQRQPIYPEMTYKIYLFDIKEMIAPPVWRKTLKAFREAKEMKADIVLIHMNTYGGMLDAADSMRTKILHSDIPVYVFIDHNAASAGALISIACDKIFMVKDATLGAATVVDEKGEKLADKYQSYMRAMMRSTAEAKGRNPDVAEAMVGAIRKMPGLADSNRVLTFTTSEAIAHHYCDGEAANIEEAIKESGIKHYKIEEQHLTIIDNLIGLLVNPVVSGILIMIIVAGLYFEFQSPGAIFPIVISGISAVLYFAPLYLEGLASNWQILLFIAGVIFVAVEVFVLPGHGISLAIGLVMVIMGLTLTMINNLGFNFRLLPTTAIGLSFFIVIIAMFGSLIISFSVSKRMFGSAIFGKKLALDTVQEKSEGFTLADNNLTHIVGKTGTARTILRPVGKIEVNNEIYDATAQTGYIEKGVKIIVVRYENAQLIVDKVNV